DHPPFAKSNYLTWKVTENLIDAHRVAYRAIKQALGPVPVGIAKNSACFEAFRKYNLVDRAIAGAFNLLDFYLLEKIQAQLDFIGLNYYTYRHVKFDWRHLY